MHPFFKMSGSGNDFVFFDGRAWNADQAKEVESTDRIRAICTRGTGVGADGIVVLARSTTADLAIRYYNADGSTASLCGNATLCTVRLSVELGITPSSSGLRIETAERVVTGRLVGEAAEFDLGGVEKIETRAAIPLVGGERRIGYAVAGIPHFVVLVDNVARVDVITRGRTLRQHESAGPEGANVNFVSPRSARPEDGCDIRTYERGVEGETLACGTGAVASAAVLAAWDLARSERPIRLWTRSGSPLDVRLEHGAGGVLLASLRGEGRIVFRGELA